MTTDLLELVDKHLSAIAGVNFTAGAAEFLNLSQSVDLPA